MAMTAQGLMLSLAGVSVALIRAFHARSKRNLSTTSRHRRLRFTEQFLLLWVSQVG